jgi:hypothetical protein
MARSKETMAMGWTLEVAHQITTDHHERSRIAGGTRTRADTLESSNENSSVSVLALLRDCLWTGDYQCCSEHYFDTCDRIHAVGFAAVDRITRRS